MRHVFIFTCIGFLFVLYSCKSLKDVDIKGIARQVPTESVTTALAGEIDLKSDEVLCAATDHSMTDNNYYAAKIMTPASPATKNQAKVLFLDGKEKWTNFVIPSHKSTNAEMQLGKHVLFLPSYSMHEDITIDNYRKSLWRIGRITSTDELFKNMVEIKGRKYYIKWTRIPETIIK